MNGFNVCPFGHTAASKKYEASSRFWKNFTLIGIPAAVIISGLTAGLVVGLR
jgi:hypothetical protein